MIKNEIVGTNTYVYYEKLPNGLDVYLIPFNNKKKYYGFYGTRYGSNDTNFYLDGKEVKVPDGIAHFLEHKMFNQESGEEPFEFYSKSGSYVNASTSFTKTCYYFNGINNFEENLNYLIDFVNSPYFTDETVEKEKNIIVEEINMNNDSPGWKIEEEINKMLYHKINYRIPIGGFEKSVRSITKEDLKVVYDNFYNPNNMILIVAGDIKVKEVINLIKNNESLKKRTKKDIPKLVPYNEPYEVVLHEKELLLNNVTTDKLCFSLKLKIKDFNLSKYDLDINLSILFNMIFGNTSIFKEEMINNSMFTSFYQSSKYDDDYITVNFYAETDKPKELVNYIKDYIRNSKFEEKELDRYKKVMISNAVFNSDNENAMINDLFGDLIDFGEYKYDIIDFVKKIKLEDIIKIQKNIDLNNSSTLIVKSKEK